MSTKAHIYILGTRIDNLTKKETIHKVNVFLESDTLHHIVTVNPEIILKSQRDAMYRKILNNSSLNVADGVGITFAFWRHGNRLQSRYTGIALMWDMLYIANEKKLNVFLVANKDGLSSWQETRDAILKVYPQLCIDGKNIDLYDDVLPSVHGQLLFFNLGAPQQELLISALNDSHNASTRIAMGVGGAFDYITGHVVRAPKFMRSIGFEWLYRLFKQPSRVKRIFYAVVIFPILVLINKK